MRRSPLTLIDEIKKLCYADRLTARSFLCALNLQELPRVIDDGIAHPPEFLQALQNKLFDMPKGNTISKQTVTNSYCRCLSYQYIDFVCLKIEMLSNFLTKLTVMANETELLDSYK